MVYDILYRNSLLIVVSDCRFDGLAIGIVQRIRQEVSELVRRIAGVLE